jgi:hypothetical protein
MIGILYKSLLLAPVCKLTCHKSKDGLILETDAKMIHLKWIKKH